MCRFLNPDNEAFRSAVNSEIYIDKSGLIACTNRMLGSKQAFICNSRPRRFGKSMAADMLAAYYSRGCDSEAMFESLEIGRQAGFREHLNQYDVIHLDVQWMIGINQGTEGIVDFIQARVLEDFRQIYPEIVSENTTTIAGAMSSVYAATGNKFVVIIDEWDVLIRDDAHNLGVQEEYIDFLRSMFKGVEPTRYIALAYLTGILPIKRERTQSALNNFDEYTMLGAGRFTPYVGFTEDEVRGLCEQYGRDYSEVRRWYDGYTLDGVHLYNPRAVVSVMLQGRFQSYWSQTGTYKSVQSLIEIDYDGLRSAVLAMLAGDRVPVRTRQFQNDMISLQSKDDVITLLIHLGYLAYDQDESAAYIPNEEIRYEFECAVEGNQWNEFVEFQNVSNDLLHATLELDGDAVAAGVERIHTEYASTIQYNNENSLSSVLAIAYLSSMQYYFRPIRELPTGRGFADYVYLPKPRYAVDYPALVVELKWNQNARTALEQIRERDYPQSLLQYTGDILLVGINYDKATRQHTCVIERYQR